MPKTSFRLRYWIAGVVLALVLPIALLSGALYTEDGARLSWQLATHMLAGKLSGEFAGGSLDDGLHLRNVSFRGDAQKLAVDRIDVQWHWSLSPPMLDIDVLRVGTLDFTSLPAPRKPTLLPQRITLPMAINVRDATLQKFVLHRDGTTTEINDVALTGHSDGEHHALKLLRAGTPYGKLNADLQLDGLRPFAIAGSARLRGSWREHEYRLDSTLSGNLETLNIALDAGGAIEGRARIAAAPFEEVPLQRAQVTVRKLDPRLIVATAPQAELDLDANLSPMRSNGPTATSMMAVAGTVSVRNTKPGTIDAGLMPLVSAKAEVRLDTQAQRFENLQAELTGAATLQGNGELHPNKTGRLALHAKALDLHALHSKLKPTRLDGPLDIALADGKQHIVLKLAGPALSVQADALVDARQVAVTEAQLQAGAARLTASGSLDRDETRAYTVRGNLANFNPALFIANKAAEARINMEFDARGKLKPALEAQMQFAVHDSSYGGRPMSGGGKLHLVGNQLDAKDVQLAMAGNQLRLDGSFGKPGDRLKFNVDAPALAGLGFGMSGKLQANGEAGGSVERPAINADFRATQLAFGQYQIADLSGHADTSGVPGRQPDARIALQLIGREIHAGELNLATLVAAVDGSYADHRIRLDAAGTLRNKTQSLQVGAQGKLRQLAEGYAWDGTVRTLDGRGLVPLALAAPVTVGVAPHRAVLGPARMTVDDARIDLKGFRLDGTQLASEGTLSGLQISRLLELQRTLTGTAPSVATDLVLDGRWNFSLADTGTGFFQLERRSGDVRMTGEAGSTALGLTALRMRGDLQGRTVRFDAAAEAGRIGSAEATGSIALQVVDGRLVPAADSTVDGRIAATLPKLQRIASLAGPKIALDGSMRADLVVRGTLADPVVSGDATGSNLALALYDQGVRLHDGSAQLHLDSNTIEIRQLVFRGGDGTLRATGSIPLNSDTPDISAAIVADRLQLLSDPARQATVSGRATAANVAGRLRIDGKFTVDSARFQLPEKSAPQLGDDVVVIRGKQRLPASDPRVRSKLAGERKAGRFTPEIAVQLDLGNDFRFEGSGAKLLLAGTLDVTSAPSEQPEANGTVRVVEGTYETFGAKLAIERGVINFDGTFTNPNINILAMRRSQDVAAGVQVTGTVRQPRAQLVSEPDVPEQEKLNWLVFGRGGDSGEAGSGQAQAAAKDAALGLLNKVGGTRVAQGLGLDKLSIGSSDFGLGSQQVVSLGKDISQRLSVGYEQSLAGAEGVLKLTYELSRHWSVVVRGGSIGGLDVLYSKRFDHFGERSEGR